VGCSFPAPSAITRAQKFCFKTIHSRSSIPKHHSRFDVGFALDPFPDLWLISTTYYAGGNILLQDLLAIHMVREVGSSTIISYHPTSSWRRPSAKRLHSLVNRAGQSVYWQKIFTQSKDPTFLFLAIMWYSLYAWDHSFEVLYAHINWLVRSERFLTIVYFAYQRLCL
jgi:hypothetical protein